MSAPQPDDARLQELVQMYLCGDAGEAELRELARLLESQGDYARQVAWEISLGGMIAGWFRAESDENFVNETHAATQVNKDDPNFIQQTMEKIDDRVTAGRTSRSSTASLLRRHKSSARLVVRRKSRGLWPYSIIAAALLLVAGLLVFTKGKPGRQTRLAKRSPAQLKDRPLPMAVSEASGLSTVPVALVPQQPTPTEQPPKSAPQSAPKPVEQQQVTPQPSAIPALPPMLQPTPQGKVAGAPTKPKTQPGEENLNLARAAPVTERPLARIAKIVGSVRYARGLKGRWIQAVEGISLLAGDRLHTRTGMVRLDMVGGSTVYANKNSVLRLVKALTHAGQATLVDLTQGQVFVVDEGMSKVHVETPDGLISPVGTRFDVALKFSWTRVVVEEGTVEALAKAKRQETHKPARLRRETTVNLRGLSWVQKAVRVRFGQQAHLRAGARPTVSRTTRSVSAWRKRLGETVVAFYLDPDVAGGGDGSELHPWTALHNPQWAAINSALAKSNVTVFCSAREADADVNEKTATEILIARTDTSTHRLTLDGMSKYNQSDTCASWRDYRGKSRFQISARYPIGTVPRRCSYVTIRGFKAIATFGQSISYWGGNHVMIEYCEVTAQAPKHGPSLQFGNAFKADGSRAAGSCTEITIRHNDIHHTHGQGIHIGGAGVQSRRGHDRIIIEYNRIHDVGVHGGKGHGIHVYPGNRNVVVRGNQLYMTRAGAGMDGMKVMSAALIEKNFICNFGRHGIVLDVSRSTPPNRNGATIRNNVVVNCGGNPEYPRDYGILIEGGAKAPVTSTGIYNNTVFNTRGTGLYVNQHSRDTTVRNNIITASLRSNLQVPADVAQDHNLIVSRGKGKGPRFLNPQLPYKAENFKLKAGSPAIDTGAAIATFSDDYQGVARPQGGAWDVGAFERR